MDVGKKLRNIPWKERLVEKAMNFKPDSWPFMIWSLIVILGGYATLCCIAIFSPLSMYFLAGGTGAVGLAAVISKWGMAKHLKDQPKKKK